MSAVESALAVGKRVRGGTHLAEVRVGTDMDLTDQLQVVVEDHIEIPALLSRLREDHRKMQAHNADIEAANKHRNVILVRRFHAASLIPRGKKGAASHGAYDLSILFIHAGDISLTAQ